MKKKILWVAFAILSGNLLQAATKAPTETPLTKSWGHCPPQGYKDTSKGVCITCDSGYKYNNTTKTCENNK